MAARRRQKQEWEVYLTFFDDGNNAQCKYCDKTFQYKSDWPFNPFGYNAKSTQNAHCLKQKFISCGGIIPTRLSYTEMWGTWMPEGGKGVACLSQAGQNNLADGSILDVYILTFVPAQSQGEPSKAASNTLRLSSLRQQHMSKTYHIAKWKELDEKWATFFYEANVAFNVVRHPSFIAAMRATSQARFDYDPPLYRAMRMTLIEPRKKHVEEEVKKATKKSIEIYGATICIDGWDNIICQLLMNVMLSCPIGDIFLGSIDTSRNKKAYIATELKKFINAVGPRFVTQICTNNAINMLGPWTTLLQRTSTFSNKVVL